MTCVRTMITYVCAMTHDMCTYHDFICVLQYLILYVSTMIAYVCVSAVRVMTHRLHMCHGIHVCHCICDCLDRVTARQRRATS